MKFGNFLFPESRDPTRDADVFQETLREARRAEELGMDALWLAEHHFDGACVYVDPTSFAAGLATATKRVKIGFAVLQTSLYHPLRLAERLCVVDQLSQGRLLVGLGRGSNFNAYEYSAFQVAESDAQARFEEAEDILRKCWAGGSVTHEGRFWKFHIPMLRPLPYQRPHPPILHSVARDESAVALARKAIPFLTMGSRGLDILLRRINLFHASLEESGHSPDTVRHVMDASWASNLVVIADTDQEAERLGAPAFQKMMEHRIGMVEKYGMKQGAGSSPVGALCGSPATVAERLAPIARSSLGGLISNFRFGPMPAEVALNSMELFMGKVAPELRREHAGAARTRSAALA